MNDSLFDSSSRRHRFSKRRQNQRPASDNRVGRLLAENEPEGSSLLPSRHLGRKGSRKDDENMAELSKEEPKKDETKANQDKKAKQERVRVLFS